MSRELIEAAKAVIADRDHLGAMFEWEGNDVLTSPNAVRWQAFVAAVRAAEAAPVAETVAVPVETLRELRSIATKPLTDQDCRNVCAAVRATVDALLPPPPAPEPVPSAELQKQWDKEAMAMFPIRFGENNDLRREGYVAGRRAEWVASKKGGG